MEELLKEIQTIEEEIESLEEGYAQECFLLTQKKGFDSYKNKWRKKIDALAEKYADLILPLKHRHDEIRAQIADIEEEERKKKYIDVY